MHRNRNPSRQCTKQTPKQLFSHGKNGSRARAPNDDVGQHGGLTRVNTKSCSLGLQCVSLILNINAMVNWRLSKQGIRWPVSCDHIAGSGLELEILCFLKLTADQALVFSIGSRAHGSLICSDQGQELIEVWIFLLYKCFSLLLRHGLMV